MPRKITKEQFVDRADKIHNFKYDYTNVTYAGNHIKVEIYCSEHDKIFYQTPGNHLSGITSCKCCSSEKRKQTLLKNYGVEYALQSSKFMEKRKQTLISRYGVEHALLSPKIMEQVRQTNLKNYGTEYASQSPIAKTKKKRTLMERYGVEHNSQMKSVKDKKKNLSLVKYDRAHHAQKHISKTTLSYLNDKMWLLEEHYNKKQTLQQIAKNLNIDESTVGRYMRKYDIKTHRYQQSVNEKILGDFIRSLGYKIETNNYNIISPYELDIFIPEINVAIEYNGSYWHKNKGNDYHKNKTDLCNSLNIDLIHVWEQEWIDDVDDVKTNIQKVLDGIPLQQLEECVIMDLSTESVQRYCSLGYNIVHMTSPLERYDDTWDCGFAILKRVKF